MTELTMIYFNYNIYNANKVKVKNIISKYGLSWQASKMKLGLPHEIILEAYKLFKIDDKISKDENLKGRSGSVGLWSNEKFSVKIIMFDKKTEDEHLPVLLVFKGIETSEFYHDLMAYCANLGCTISKIVEVDGKYEEIFRKRINIELVNDLNSVSGTKKVLCNMFDNHINNTGHGKFSDSFIAKWKECIKKYGNYTFRDLINEMIENEKKRMLIKTNDVENKIIKDKEETRIDVKHKFKIKRREIKNIC